MSEADAARPYLYDQGWSDERRRLAALAGIYDPGTFRLLEQVGVAPGWACLEVGAGEGSVARRLADLTGPTGRVLAVDLDPRHMAGETAYEVRAHDILDGPPESGAFELAHARAVIEWIPDRAAAIANMVAALKPGGVLLLEDVDIAGAKLGFPENGLRDAAVTAVGRLAAAGGADLYFGRELRKQLADAGLVGIESDVRTVLQRGGEPTTDFQRLTLEQLAPVLVAQGLLTEAEVSQSIADLADPQIYGYPPLMVAAWGRKPG